MMRGRLKDPVIAYETWGQQSRDRDNAVLIFTGLSPSAHVASSPEDPTAGWWEDMVGPDKPIDTNRYFVICVNSLGSCFGSTGPASMNPGDRQTVSPDLSRVVRRGHRARRRGSRAFARNRVAVRNRRRVDGRNDGACVLHAAPESVARSGVDLLRQPQPAVRNRTCGRCNGKSSARTRRGTTATMRPAKVRSVECGWRASSA